MELAKEKYTNLLQALRCIEEAELPEVTQVERCFQTCFDFWQQAEGCIHFHLLRACQRIIFIKTVRSPFIAQMEYYLLRYHAILFLPSDQKGRKAFWQREELRLVTFREEHPAFYQYYKSKKTDQDTVYYTGCSESYFPGISNKAPYIFLGKLMALERYLVFIREQIRKG